MTVNPVKKLWAEGRAWLAVIGSLESRSQSRIAGGQGFNEAISTSDCPDRRNRRDGVFAEENFGPVAAITSFAEEEEALQRANGSAMGLSAYAFTSSPDRARRAVATLKSGMVGINSFALAAAEAPFGGTNYSGLGREGGSEGIDDYLETKLAQIVF